MPAFTSTTTTVLAAGLALCLAAAPADAKSMERHGEGARFRSASFELGLVSGLAGAVALMESCVRYRDVYDPSGNLVGARPVLRCD